MTLNQKISNYLNNSHPRVLGRYRASEIGSIRSGWKLPENYFKPDPISEENYEIVLRGMAYEGMLNEILKGDCRCGDNQSKYEIKINDEIVLVCKPDYEWETAVWETKYPSKPLSDIPLKYKDQLECEYRATGKKVLLGVFGEPFNITLYEYKPSDKRWENIKKDIITFHEAVKKYGEQI